jgi:hypothetical protein
LPLPRVTQAFHQYFRGESGWRDDLRWDVDKEKLEISAWYESWWIYLVALLAITGFFVWWRGWW